MTVPPGLILLGCTPDISFPCLVEVGVLLGGHHPAPVDAGGGTRLHGDAAAGPVRLALHEGVVIEQAPRDAEAVRGGSLAGVGALGPAAVQRVQAEEDEHRYGQVFRYSSS